MRRTPRTRRKTADGAGGNAPQIRRAPARRCNLLDGKRWIQNSISVWSDIRKSAEEARLGHPALFPQMLVTRLIETFLPPEGTLVLDPFAGSGSTVVAAAALGKRGVGLELSPEYAALGRARLEAIFPSPAAPQAGDDTFAEAASGSVIHEAAASRLLEFVAPGTADFCLTSPPYWNILNQRRTADGKEVRHYGNRDGDLGTIADYESYLDALATVFAKVFAALKPGAYCCAVVMDLRKKNRFYPLHSDLASRLTPLGFTLDDLIIWNRQSEYNNLRPLGYPAVFRVNKVHEFVVVLQKPKAPAGRVAKCIS